MQTLVIDTNIALDLLVFRDEASVPLKRDLLAARVRWLATPAMREELRRVLGYQQVAPRMHWHGLTQESVLAEFDALTHTVAPAAKASVVCKDSDDQQFIDLALAHQAILLSKDRQVLKTRKRLEKLGVQVGSIALVQR